MNAEILSVGTELLMGQIANTNAQFISQKLQEIGIGVYYHSVVGDNEGRLKKSIKSSLERLMAEPLPNVMETFFPPGTKRMSPFFTVSLFFPNLISPLFIRNTVFSTS